MIANNNLLKLVLLNFNKYTDEEKENTFKIIKIWAEDKSYSVGNSLYIGDIAFDISHILYSELRSALGPSKVFDLRENDSDHIEAKEAYIKNMINNIWSKFCELEQPDLDNIKRFSTAIEELQNVMDSRNIRK